VDLYGLWYCRAVAGRVAPALLRSIPMLVIAGLMGWIRCPRPLNAAACAAALLGAVALSSAVATLMSISMFWTISARGLNAVILSTTFLLSGMIVPLPLFPDALQPLLNALPFRGLCDVPFRLFTGHIPAGDLPGELAHQLAWAAVIVLCGRCLLGRAVRRLVVQGG